MKLQRHQLLHKIRTALGRSRIVALLGPRQAGKTTLARISHTKASTAGR